MLIMKNTSIMALILGLIVGITLAFGMTVKAQAATCTTSAQFGECFAGSNPYVEQNVWNAGADHGWAQTLTASSVGHWTIKADMEAGNRSVISYPSIVQSTNDEPIADYSKIYGEFNAALPAKPGATDDYEAAFDIWLNGNCCTTPAGQEIMVWTNTHNQTPAGSNTGVTWKDPTFGVVYDIWANTNNSTVTFVAQTNKAASDVNLLGVLQTVVANYSFNGDNELYQADYGYEICSTSGVSETFTLDGYAFYNTIKS
jgi:hypothetical protein